MVQTTQQKMNPESRLVLKKPKYLGMNNLGRNDSSEAGRGFFLPKEKRSPIKGSPESLGK